MAPGYQHKNTNVFMLHYHFVFCPKRRRKVLIGRVKERLVELINQKAAEFGWEVIALEVMADHVHLFIASDPEVAPNQMMHRLKGYTSRILRSEFPHLNTLPSLWTRSFFVSTAGNVSSQKIQHYIANQSTRD